MVASGVYLLPLHVNCSEAVVRTNGIPNYIPHHRDHCTDDVLYVDNMVPLEIIGICSKAVRNMYVDRLGCIQATRSKKDKYVVTLEDKNRTLEYEPKAVYFDVRLTSEAKN